MYGSDSDLSEWGIERDLHKGSRFLRISARVFRIIHHDHAGGLNRVPREYAVSNVARDAVGAFKRDLLGEILVAQSLSDVRGRIGDGLVRSIKREFLEREDVSGMCAQEFSDGLHVFLVPDVPLEERECHVDSSRYGIIILEPGDWYTTRMTTLKDAKDIFAKASWMQANLPELEYFGASVLNERCREFEESEFGGAEMSQLASKLEQTLRTYREYTGTGRGLAANQVGSNKRMIAVWLEDTMVFAVNPKATQLDGTGSYFESCLSGGGVFSGEVIRPWTGTFEYFDLKGERHELVASPIQTRLFLHEIDHLDGNICFDKYEPHTVRLLSTDPAQVLKAELKRLD